MTALRARSLQHVRPVVPLDFPSSEPESEHMGQGGRHYRMCKALYEILRAAAGDEHTVSSDAFVYFDAGDPNRKLAPDGAVKLGIRQHDFDSWKTWESGAPELAFEILSPSDSPERWTFEDKLLRYRALGVTELVVFHADGEHGARLRVWDRIDGDLVERTVTGEATPCLTLDAHLVVGPLDDLAACVRLAHDSDGRRLYPPKPRLDSARPTLDDRPKPIAYARPTLDDRPKPIAYARPTLDDRPKPIAHARPTLDATPRRGSGKPSSASRSSKPKPQAHADPETLRSSTVRDTASVRRAPKPAGARLGRASAPRHVSDCLGCEARACASFRARRRILAGQPRGGRDESARGMPAASSRA
ncbi:MAG: Uma2 family endonuclease [Labilithrix sp.]|nr:Uma2 family endonuclease [Labilithrix sp.]